MQDTLKINHSLIFENMIAGLCVAEARLGADGKPVDFIVSEVNISFEKLFKVCKDYIVGQTIFVLCEDVKTELFEILKDIYLNGGTEKIDIYRKDIDKHLSIRLFRPDNGYVAGLIHDITKRKRAEIKLKNSEENFRNLYKNVAGCVVVVDDNYIIRDVNKRTCEVTGFSREELVGHLCDRICPKGMSSKKCPIWEENQEGFVGMDTNVKAKDGSMVPIIKDARRLMIDGQACIFENFHDISELKRIEEELKIAKEKAEESNRLKSAFLANVSHEIRTPMNGILGFADLLKEPHLSGETQKQYLDVIERSGKRMLSIINDLVDISKIEAGQIDINYDNISIKELIKEQYEFFKPIAAEKGLKLDCVCYKDVEIETDSVRVGQILSNLLNNAIKYTHKGGIRFGYIIRKDFCELFVADTGVGIIKDLYDRVFERFVQGDLEITRKHDGVGLGLSISKALVEKLGGKIWLRSSPGVGTTFYFDLPLKHKE